MYVDGKSVGHCGDGSATGTAVGVSTPLALKMHTAVLLCQKAPCEIYAVEGAAGQSGISLDNIAVGGCTAECFGMHPSTQLAFEDLAEGRHALVILDTISNEPGMNYSITSFRNATMNVIRYERQAHQSPSLLIYSPMQDKIAGLAPFYPVLTELATSEGTAFVDMHAKHPVFDERFFGPEGAHENALGHAEVYRAISETIK